jgi:superfamily II DNA or RNA helicase
MADDNSFESLAHLARPNSIYTLHRKMAVLVPDVVVPPLLDAERCNFRRVPHAHQIRGVKRCMEYLFSDHPGSFADLDQTEDMKKLYASISGDDFRDVEDDIEATTTTTATASSPPPTSGKAPLAHVARVEPALETRGCKISIPCGGGKTAMLLLLAIMHGGNCLIVTNNAENAMQILKTIVRETNIHLFVPVRLIKPNSKSEKGTTAEVNKKRKAPSSGATVPPARMPDHTSQEEKAELDRLIVGDDIRSDGNATRRHFLPNGGAHGITIVDINAFKEVPNACTQRTVLRRFVFQSFWNLVQFDESDAVSTADMRTAMEGGLLMDFDDGDGLGNVRRCIPLRAEHQVFWSGTWFRGDDAGREWLYKRGPMLFRERSVDLQKAGLLADVRVCVVVCDDPGSWSEPFEKKEQQLRGMPAEKCRALQLLMLLHGLHGHKIMIFSRYLSQVNMLEKLFPSAFVVKGGTRNRDQLDDGFRFEEGAVRLTTSVGERGLDMREVKVVFDLAGYGDSPSKFFQRMGRALRYVPEHTQAWVYNFVSSNDQAWCDTANQDSILQAPRYEILRLEGYLPQTRVVMSKDLHAMVLDDLRKPVIGMPKEMKLTDMAYDDPLVQTNHVLTFYRAVQCKDTTAFDASSCSGAPGASTSKGGGAKKQKKAQASSNVKGISKLRRDFHIELARRREAASTAHLAASAAAASSSTAIVASAGGALVSTFGDALPPMPPYMLTKNHCKQIQSIIAASPCEYVSEDTPEMAAVDLWSLICQIRAAAEATMKRVDSDRNDIRTQIAELHAVCNPGSSAQPIERMHDKCKFGY